MSDEQFDREWIRGLLHDGTVTVTFTKKDGSERVMNCTLVESSIPEEKKPKGTSTAARSDETLAVYDIDADGWRSFRIDSIKSVEFSVE